MYLISKRFAVLQLSSNKNQGLVFLESLVTVRKTGFTRVTSQFSMNWASNRSRGEEVSSGIDNRGTMMATPNLISEVFS